MKTPPPAAASQTVHCITDEDINNEIPASLVVELVLHCRMKTLIRKYQSGDPSPSSPFIIKLPIPFLAGMPLSYMYAVKKNQFKNAVGKIPIHATSVSVHCKVLVFFHCFCYGIILSNSLFSVALASKKDFLNKTNSLSNLIVWKRDAFRFVFSVFSTWLHVISCIACNNRSYMQYMKYIQEAL